MIEERYGHASVSMGDKMFVIGGKLTASCEVFDRLSRKITAIKSQIKFSAADKSCFNAFCYNIVVFKQRLQRGETAIYMYKVNNSMWSQIDFGLFENYFLPSYLKY